MVVIDHADLRENDEENIFMTSLQKRLDRTYPNYTLCKRAEN
jgi:hypothetical protein